jgi:hypothetical protein
VTPPSLENTAQTLFMKVGEVGEVGEVGDEETCEKWEAGGGVEGWEDSARSMRAMCCLVLSCKEIACCSQSWDPTLSKHTY